MVPTHPCVNGTCACAFQGQKPSPPFVPPATSEAPHASRRASQVPALHHCTTASWSSSTLQQMNHNTGQGNRELKQHRLYSTLCTCTASKASERHQTRVNCTFQLVLKPPCICHVGMCPTLCWYKELQPFSWKPCVCPVHGASSPCLDTWIKPPAFAAYAVFVQL